MINIRPEENVLTDDEVIQVKLQNVFLKIKVELAKVIVGQEEAIEKLFLCLLSKGHGLLMGVPGWPKPC